MAEKHQELQNLDPTSSPHLEEILFGGEVDLDLLSCFPKFGQESSEGLGGIELSNIATMVEREKNELYWKFGEETLFIAAPKKRAVGAKKGAAAGPAWGRPAPRPGQETDERSRTQRSIADDRTKGGDLGSWPAPGHGPAREADGRGPNRACRPGPGRGLASGRRRPAGHPSLPEIGRAHV